MTVIARDALKLESPAAQAEWKLLLDTKVGDTRQGPLFPALDVPVEWTCTSTDGGWWEFTGLFFKQPLYRVKIGVNAGMLTLEVLS